MLDAFTDQGAGLRQATPAAAVRLIALVSQDEPAHEQPLLWQLCEALHGYGYPPTVLDGTSRESAEHPGLADLMRHTPWSALGATAHSDWAVMPAASGLRALAHAERAPLQMLGRLFRQGGVVVLYARAELLIPLLADSAAQPVLAVTPGRSALIQGYRTLKQFRQQGRLLPTLVALAQSSVRNADQLARTTGRTLQKCALTYLGCETDMITVRSAPRADHRSDDVHRLALRLLEHGAVASSI